MPPAGSGYRIEGGVVRAEDGTIAGSALHIDEAVRNLMRYADIPLETAIINATRTPARLLGLERELGTIEPGKRADLSIWDTEYKVIATLVGGVPVYGAAHLYKPSRARA
jgi:N-acetylglucosamine-6-phosphate deacetylase